VLTLCVSGSTLRKVSTGPSTVPAPAPASPGRWPLTGIAFGADYNPEQWPEEVWREDVRLMREAGVTFATLGVFSWALLQPEAGRFDLAWLDRAMDVLHEGGIAVDLATATASPPPWLSREHPETLPVDREGHRLWPGGRQAWCPSSPVFREHALTLVETLARRYAGHPALAMWHVSNELGCHNVACYCDVSAAAFRRWLGARYGEVSALNEAWGTTFWSQRYGSFEEVLPPRLGTAIPNPTQQLDYARFSSDELLDHYRAERDVLRAVTPEVPVTTNFMVTTHIKGMDYWAWAPEMDVVSQDHYLDHRLADPVHELAFCGDIVRGLAGGGPWFLMEHSTSAVNWQPVNIAKQPGELLRTSLAHVARGADAVGYFQWRASRAGAEKFHSALLPHAGTDTKVWREVSALGQLLGRAADLAGTRVDPADVALVFDWPAWWGADLDSHPSTLVRYVDQPQALHRALWRQGVRVDAVRAGSDLGAYRVVLVPSLYLVDDATAEAVRTFVHGGGHVVVTYFSGIVDENDHIRLGGYPGAFREVLGIRTEEFFPLPAHATVAVSPVSGAVSGGAADGWIGSLWTELTHLEGAEAVAEYGDGPVAGHPAVTRHEFGDGVAWYVGTSLDTDALEGLLSRVVGDAGVRPLGPPVSGVEVVRRSSDDRSFLVVVNHTGTAVEVPARGTDLVSGGRAEGTLAVPAGGCALVREDG
jgi:beta-galactosidase